jgi:hypothetical protein
LRKQLLESLGRLCIVGLRWDLFWFIFCSGSNEEIVVQSKVFEFVIKSFQGRANVAGRM